MSDYEAQIRRAWTAGALAGYEAALRDVAEDGPLATHEIDQFMAWAKDENRELLR